MTSVIEPDQQPVKMKQIELSERAGFYHRAFPNWPPPKTLPPESVWNDGRWLSGIWILGNDYRNATTYYGAYPPNYLRRVMAMFPDAQKVLHLFSGSLPPGPYTRFDLEGRDADVVGDAHQLSKHFAPASFDLILSDPPYSSEDANHYGTPMIHRNKVLHECVKVLQPGGFIVWLDQVLPMFKKTELLLCGAIGVVRSTNHRVRAVFIFKKL